jgi:hypothetical protein
MRRNGGGRGGTTLAGQRHFRVIPQHPKSARVALVRLGTAGQSLRFVSAVDGRAEGITELWLTPGLPGLPNGDGPVAEIGGVRFVVRAP